MIGTQFRPTRGNAAFAWFAAAFRHTSELQSRAAKSSNSIAKKLKTDLNVYEAFHTRGLGGVREVQSGSFIAFPFHVSVMTHFSFLPVLFMRDYAVRLLLFAFLL